MISYNNKNHKQFLSLSLFLTMILVFFQSHLKDDLKKLYIDIKGSAFVGKVKKIMGNCFTNIINQTLHYTKFLLKVFLYHL